MFNNAWSIGENWNKYVWVVKCTNRWYEDNICYEDNHISGCFSSEGKAFSYVIEVWGKPLGEWFEDRKVNIEKIALDEKSHYL